jgi:peptidoglycan L-alanyl-D-glutamate endopeptidase CwlK
MFHFGRRSRKSLSTCHPDLQAIAGEAIKTFDFTVLCGHRNKEEQDKEYREGDSQLQWPNSRHNSNPSEAMDCVPYPIDWKDIERFEKMAVVIKAAAKKLGIDIEWGGDWKRFKDYPHFELRKKQ